jgi:predicted pyridoxine 5'-phosphate oxidase superfamily flavin-nucleotide-binding protein
MDEPPFHTGEREAQRRAGFLVSRAPIRDRLPEQHRTFFAAQPFLLIAGMAADGSLAETVLTGEPGFISSPDPQTLRIEALPDSRDPFCALMAEAAAVGMLGIDFLTRQRNRVNGRIISVSCTGFTVAVGQSFGNCAKYIQARGITAKPAGNTAPRHDIEFFVGLDGEARNFIRAADTFLVASSSGPGAVANGGIDISHRGGLPGFIGVEGNRLRIPDFAGNRYFNTLGNFLRHPEAALLLIDFASGDLLHLTGTAAVDWAPAARPSTAERSWTVDVRLASRRRGALPYRWSLPEWAPSTLASGTATAA